jgi:hypothetical protein
MRFTPFPDYEVSMRRSFAGYGVKVVRNDLPPLDSTAFGSCFRVLIGGAQPDMVAGSPSHSAIKGRWGSGLEVRGLSRRQSPHWHPNPSPIKRGALPATGSSTDGGNAAPTSATPPRTSTPSSPNQWRRRTTPTPAPPPDRLLPPRPMVCDLYRLPLLFSSRRCDRDCYIYCKPRSRFPYCETTRSNESMN